MRAARLPRPQAAVVVAVALSAGALAGFAGAEPRDSAPVRLSVVVLAAAALGLALASGRQRQRLSSAEWLSGARLALLGEGPGRYGVLAWASLVVAGVAWDLVSFLERRADFPTLSRLIGYVTALGWSRGLLFALWLACGAWLATGRLKEPA